VSVNVLRAIRIKRLISIAKQCCWGSVFIELRWGFISGSDHGRVVGGFRGVDGCQS